MLENQQGTIEGNQTSVTSKDTGEPRSFAVAQKGIKTSQDFSRLMSALMSDLIEGRVTPGVGNATCNAGGKLLKSVELQYKYGTDGPGQSKSLLLTEG
jgi:hypothetical protein